MQSMFSQPVSGAYASLATLMQTQHAAKKINLLQRKSNTQLAGIKLSRFRSRGLEFEEVRPYQSGDDMRTIDWRVTARSNKPYSKLFREERECPLLLCVDQRLSSFIGSKHCFKSVLSAHIAALLAWSGTQQGDRVGGLIFNDRQHTALRPYKSRKNIFRLLQIMSQYNQALNRKTVQDKSAEDSLSAILKELLCISETSMSIFVISDFQGLNQQCLDSLTHIARHNNLYCIQVWDLLEQELPRLHQAPFSDGAKILKLNTTSAAFQKSYCEDFANKRHYIADSFQQYAIPHFLCATHQAPLDVLHQHLSSAKRLSVQSR